MVEYQVRAPRKRRWLKLVLVTTLVVALLVVGGVIAARQLYFTNLNPVSVSQQNVIVTIPSGASVKEIAETLQSKQVIRSQWAFTQYVLNKGVEDELQAGTYALKPSQTTQEIVTILTQGKIKSDLVTIKPGKRLDEVKQDLINSGFSEEAVNQALDPKLYSAHPALVDKPAEASLEGYLYPESFQKNAETAAETIIRASLDEMHKQLTPGLRAGFVAQSLSVYQAVTLASIIEREVGKAEDRPIVAQVFLKRLRMGMKLESDATASYGAILAGEEPSLTFESAYNTYLHTDLPPSPISNVTASSLQAVANPASTDWLYFVSGDDGVTYFSKTLAEHEALTAAHCKKLCN